MSGTVSVNLSISAGARLRTLTGRSTLSWSQIKLYTDCPHAFALRYIAKVKPPGTASSLAIGSAVHQLVQTELERAWAGCRPLEAGQRRAEAQAALGAIGRVVRSKADRLVDLAEEVVRVSQPVLECLLPEASEIVAVEQAFEHMLDPDLPPITGRLDLVQNSRNGTTVTDLKTARVSLRPEQVHEYWPQLALYGLWWQRQTGHGGRSEVNLRLLTVTRHRHPRLQINDTPLSVSLAERSLSLVHAAWHGIRTGSFEPRPSWRCRTCTVRQACPYGSHCSGAR